MKQTIQIRRTETRTYQLEVPQPLARQTLADSANSILTGLSPEAFGKIVGHSQSDWSVLRVEPECECAAPAAKPKRKGR